MPYERENERRGGERRADERRDERVDGRLEQTPMAAEGAIAANQDGVDEQAEDKDE